MNPQLAQLRIRNFERHYGVMSYDDVILCAEQAAKFLEDMDVFDPARSKFAREFRDYYSYAESKAELEGLTDERHCVRITYLWAMGNKMDSYSVKVPKYQRSKEEQDEHARGVITLFLVEKYGPIQHNPELGKLQVIREN